ncbi:acyl transferase [Candidatus Thiomargarita nelsonii]|uniref:Acyl transferase n=1 Tax=Candidatus Thiomargarita nelsonii TaxID=1003181 RepID=A0A0A6PB98_9GAMM|nr:acyl transferase [Candidatus Thiomargarita nelsonii]
MGGKLYGVKIILRLDRYNSKGFERGRAMAIEIIWLILQWLLMSSWIPGSMHRVFLLRLFGAKIGKTVTIKPGVIVKFPWRLQIGDFSWIGENVWIDNLANVTIGRHCCLSQGTFLCTGSHDWNSETFDLIVKPITVEDQAWLTARSTVAPGVIVREGAVLGLGSVATKELKAWWIYQGCPALAIKERSPD